MHALFIIIHMWLCVIEIHRNREIEIEEIGRQRVKRDIEETEKLQEKEERSNRERKRQ
jgi:hypothetical protein